jgi:hypothetical protein
MLTAQSVLDAVKDMEWDEPVNATTNNPLQDACDDDFEGNIYNASAPTGSFSPMPARYKLTG